MLRFLVDEDLPRSPARSLTAAGFEAADVRDVGLRGATDDVVFARSVEQRRSLLTGDLGFGNLLRFPPGSHAGIVVVRYPNDVSPGTLVDAVVGAMRRVEEAEIDGTLMIIEPGRIRRRRAR